MSCPDLPAWVHGSQALSVRSKCPEELVIISCTALPLRATYHQDPTWRSGGGRGWGGMADSVEPLNCSGDGASKTHEKGTYLERGSARRALHGVLEGQLGSIHTSRSYCRPQVVQGCDSQPAH